MSEVNNFPKVVESKVTVMWRNVEPVLQEEGVLISAIVDCKQYIGAEYDRYGSSRPRGRSALTPTEEARFMPTLIGIGPNHPDWEQRLNDFWHSFRRLVPYPQLELDTSMEYRDENDLGTPVNHRDYITWRYCQVYSNVANSRATVNKAKHIRFYLHSDVEEAAYLERLQTLKDTAFGLRLQVAEDEKKRKAVLMVIDGTVPLREIDQKLRLAQLTDKDPNQFIEVVKDSNLLLKSFIRRCVNAGVIVNPPDTTLYLYDSTSIGQTLDQAVAFLKDNHNAVTKEEIQSKLKKVENSDS